jgi:hypothetical protein
MRRLLVTSTALVAVLLVAAAVGCTPTTLPAGPGAATPPPSGNGVVGVNPPIAIQPGALTKTVRYGPWTVPAATGDAFGQEGSIHNEVDALRVEKPCDRCYIVGIEPQLKHTDGRVANWDTGQMLHHVVLIEQGRPDPTCDMNDGVGALGQRFFASGNERTKLRAPAGYGYPVGSGGWTLIYDLMNHTRLPTNVYIEFTFKYVPIKPGVPLLKTQRPVWLDVANCTFGDVTPRTGSFSFTYDWTVDNPGKILGIGGHLHDGGSHISITNQSTGKLICNSVAGYGGPGYESDHGTGHGGEHDDDHGSPPTTDGHGHTDADHARMHLSSMSQCVAPNKDSPLATISRGQKLRLTAYYDTAKHPPHGSHPLMGISIIYIDPLL